ncbi:MAG: thioredoxin-dependent thiol peroxidase [Armatimonadetes bacterium]|nr:thioredoxin-dependent thiol peroxidase [Armatimonadota bacterium]
MIDAGQHFPDFELEDQNGRVVRLDDLKGSKAVIYFYPKDDTPGCTTEACEFRDRAANLKGAQVFGVSPDPAKKHKKFADKFGLGFPLLADPEKKLIEACGLWVEKTLYGRKYMGVDRTTFLLDEKGVVARVWRKVKPEGHAEEVLRAL